jgi:hypothetical protein
MVVPIVLESMKRAWKMIQLAGNYKLMVLCCECACEGLHVAVVIPIVLESIKRVSGLACFNRGVSPSIYTDYMCVFVCVCVCMCVCVCLGVSH